MTSVAGDFYDYIIVDDHQVGLLIADVSGHGVFHSLLASSTIPQEIRGIVLLLHS